MTTPNERDDGADAGRPGPDETTDAPTAEIRDALLATLADAIDSLAEAEKLINRYRDLGRTGRAIAEEWVAISRRSVEAVRDQIFCC